MNALNQAAATTTTFSPREPLRTTIQPGSEAIPGPGSGRGASDADQDHGARASVTTTTTTTATVSTPPPLEATIVDADNEQRRLRQEIQHVLDEQQRDQAVVVVVPRVHATPLESSSSSVSHENCCTCRRQRRRLLVCATVILAMMLVAVLAAVVSIIVTTSTTTTTTTADNDDSSPTTTAPPPTVARPFSPAPSSSSSSSSFRGPGEWVQRGSDLDGEAMEDRAGFAVAMSKDAMTVAVGAYTNDGVSGQDSGHVRVYTWDSYDDQVDRNEWIQLGQDLDGVSPGDRFGRSVALSGNGRTIAVGSRFHGVNAGQVRVFSFQEVGNVWLQVGQDIDGSNNFDLSGHDVALSSDGNTLAVTAPYNDDFGTDAGQLRVFVFDGSIWRQRGGSIGGHVTGGELGRSVSLSSDGLTVAVSATFDFEDSVIDPPGNVRVLTWNGNEWYQLGRILSGRAKDDGYGNSVSLSSNGRVVAIGSPLPSSVGFVEVHAYDGVVWVQLGKAIEGKSSSDQFGRSIALSDDGTTLVSGAFHDDSNGSRSGSTSIFWFDGTAWKQLGPDIVGEAEDDRNGWSVAISGNGDSIVTGARLNDGAGSNAGHARVFDFLPGEGRRLTTRVRLHWAE